MQQAARVSDMAGFFLADQDRAGILIEYGKTSQLFTNPTDNSTAGSGTTASRRSSGGCSTTRSASTNSQVRSIEGKGTTAPGEIDFALLTDGLRAEREAQHHYRRGLPLLFHGAAQVHHRGHAGPLFCYA